jgi:hypothetical protein
MSLARNDAVPVIAKAIAESYPRYWRNSLVRSCANIRTVETRHRGQFTPGSTVRR